MNDLILNATDLHKGFYRPQTLPILKGINLKVRRGETVAIVGRSGQGKSTLLQVLGTLDTPCKGTLEIGGKQVSGWNRSNVRNRHVAFIFQTFHLLDDYSAIDNVLMPAKIGRHATHEGSEMYLRAVELLEHVGLSDRTHYNTKLLSGGEKQRVAIARAFCNNPDLIFADEPTGNLDLQTATPIHSMLIDYAKQHGHGIVVVTHDPSLAALCDQQYQLTDGILKTA
jgi:lipoprotein-releasing system ATP-binding protein